MPSTANQTRVKILHGVLHLERFSVHDLCLYTGLDRSKVYRELAVLQKQRVLHSRTVTFAPEEKQPRHRPPKVYELTADQGKREELEQQVAGFLPPEPDAPARTARQRQVHEGLSAVALELRNVTRKVDLEEWTETLKEKLTTAERELRRLVWQTDLV